MNLTCPLLQQIQESCLRDQSYPRKIGEDSLVTSKSICSLCTSHSVCIASSTVTNSEMLPILLVVPSALNTSTCPGSRFAFSPNFCTHLGSIALCVQPESMSASTLSCWFTVTSCLSSLAFRPNPGPAGFFCRNFTSPIYCRGDRARRGKGRQKAAGARTTLAVAEHTAWTRSRTRRKLAYKTRIY